VRGVARVIPNGKKLISN